MTLSKIVMAKVLLSFNGCHMKTLHDYLRNSVPLTDICGDPCLGVGPMLTQAKHQRFAVVLSLGSFIHLYAIHIWLQNPTAYYLAVYYGGCCRTWLRFFFKFVAMK
jgi:hypothetical protein